MKESARKGYFSLPEKLAAIHQLFDYLVTREIPAGSVRDPKHMVTCGKTPVLSGDEMRQLLDSIDTSELIGLRDRGDPTIRSDVLFMITTGSQDRASR